MEIVDFNFIPNAILTKTESTNYSASKTRKGVRLEAFLEDIAIPFYSPNSLHVKLLGSVACNLELWHVTNFDLFIGLFKKINARCKGVGALGLRFC